MASDDFAFRSNPRMLLKRVPGRTPVEVYHGTTKKAAERIRKEGLLADAGGDARQGLHVTVDPTLAHQYSEGPVFKTTIPRGKLRVNRAFLDPDAWAGEPVAATVRGGKVPPGALKEVKKED